MTSNLAASLYLVSGVFFILALRGLSSPETSRQGNFFGFLGMALAITVTFLSIDIFFGSFVFIICALLIGGSIGAIIAYRISMTAMPQLVAGFHSFVGLAAAQPEYELSIEITTGISAPPIGIIKRTPIKKEMMINIQNIWLL